MRIIAIPALGLALSLGLAGAVDKDDKVERKHVTIVNGTGADGSSEISREIIKECIVSLPSEAALEPEVTGQSIFLKEINGDPAKSGWTKVYAARIGINYLLYRKEMVIVTQKSLEGKDPLVKEVDQRLPQTKEVKSDPAEGDVFAGRSNREYYYTSAEAAAKDAKQRAKIWVKQQAPLLCAEK